MATFVLTLDWTDQRIRIHVNAVSPQPTIGARRDEAVRGSGPIRGYGIFARAEAAKALAKKVGVEIKEVYLTTSAMTFLSSPKRGSAITSPNSRLQSPR